MTSRIGSVVNAESPERIGTMASASNRSGRRPHVVVVRPTQGEKTAPTICENTIKADTASEDECPSECASASLTWGKIEAFANWNRKRHATKARKRTSLKSVQRLALLGLVA